MACFRQFDISFYGREAEALAKLRALTQRNAELACESQQAQKAAATMDLKLERLHKELAAARKAAAAHDNGSTVQLEQMGAQVRTTDQKQQLPTGIQ